MKKQKYWGAKEKRPEVFGNKIRGLSEAATYYCFWVASTGSSSKEVDKAKYVALDLPAFISVIEKQVSFMKLQKKDRFLNCLPSTHIAYIALRARAEFLGAYFEDVSKNKWDPFLFAEKFNSEEFSFSSLVPTQVFDLVKNNIRGPGLTTHKILVGGAGISEDLLKRGKDLGWCFLASFGATEFGSAIAINPQENFLKDDFRMKLINSFPCETSEDGFLKLDCSRLLRAYAYFDTKSFIATIDKNIFQQDGSFLSEDKVAIDEEAFIKVFGRGSRFIIRNGENIFLDEIQNKLQASFDEELVILKTKQERVGELPVLILPMGKNISNLQIEKLQDLPAMDRPVFAYNMPIERADTGKIKYAVMQDKLDQLPSSQLISLK